MERSRHQRGTARERGRGRRGGGGPPSVEKEPKTGWRRFVPSWKTALAAMGVGLLSTLALIGVAYARTPVPTAANQEATREATVFQYRDGTEIARIGTNRISIPLANVPQHVRDAVLAAENRGFYSEPGVSPKGIARALWSTLTGRQVQGGSTITQQLARNYYNLSRERTVARKLKEIFIAIKLDQRKSKDEILELYLNTVYFGRNANGIQAASLAYFNRNAQDLTPEQGALLAAMIQRPGFLDPVGEGEARTALVTRWQYVINGMAQFKPQLYGSLPSKARFPTKFKKNWRGNAYAGNKGYMITWAVDELVARGIPRESIESGGLRIKTTFDKKLMEAAEKAVEGHLARLPKDVHAGLAAVEPDTGRVAAFYGGKDFLKQNWNDARQTTVQAGSAFKPYVLAAALEQGISLKSYFSGKSPLIIPGNKPIRNSGGKSYKPMDLTSATQHSVNTVYAKLGHVVGLENVIDIAAKAGLPRDNLERFNTQAILSIGAADVSPLHQASGFATFAAGGTHTKSHVIVEVKEYDGGVMMKEKREQDQVFGEDTAADATYAMQRVVQGGTGTAARLYGRPVAGKTGTTDQNKSVWFVGYVPQMSTSVGMYRGSSPGRPDRLLRGVGGLNELFGGTFPARIWREFMTQAMQGKPVESFPNPVFSGTRRYYAPKPTPTPAPTTPTPTPTRSTEPPPPFRPSPPGRNCPPWRLDCPTKSPEPPGHEGRTWENGYRPPWRDR